MKISVTTNENGVMVWLQGDEDDQAECFYPVEIDGRYNVDLDSDAQMFLESVTDEFGIDDVDLYYAQSLEDNWGVSWRYLVLSNEDVDRIRGILLSAAIDELEGEPFEDLLDLWCRFPRHSAFEGIVKVEQAWEYPWEGCVIDLHQAWDMRDGASEETYLLFCDEDGDWEVVESEQEIWRHYAATTSSPGFLMDGTWVSRATLLKSS